MTVGELIVRLGADISELDKALQGAETKVQRAGLRIGDIFKTAIATAIGFSLADVGRQIINFAKDITMTAGRTQALEYAMLAVADAAGYGAKAALDTKKALQEANIAEQEAIKITTRLMQAQIDLAYAIKLSKIAQDAAIIANMGSSEAAERLVEAIATQRTELLDVFGFTKNLNDIMRDYTATIGKNVNQLTEYDRRMAMLNYILQEGQKIAGAYDRAMSAPFKRWGSFVTRILPDFKSKLGEVMLPLFDLIVTGLSNAVKSLSAWIEQNKTTLIAWGRAFANAMSQAWAITTWAARAIARQWSILRPIILSVVWAFLSFKVATVAINAASSATKVFTFVMALLRGETVATTGILSIVSRAIQIYRLQLHLASMSGITHLGVIQSLRVALYSLWTALGPLGWAIIGVSAALTAGIGLWMKYVSSVEKANLEKVMEAQNKQFADSAGYTKSAADNMGDLSDKTKKASKAAHDNLQSFDEIHSVMEDISSTEPQMPELGEMGGLENLGDLAKMPGIDLSAIEQVKPTLAGFWDWIKQGFANAWDWIKEKTGTVWDWIKEKVGNTWDWLRTNVGPYLAPVGQLIGTMWGNAKTLTVDILKALKDFVVGTFRNIFTFSVETTKATVDFVVNLWSNLLQFAKNIFLNIYNFVSGTWQNIKQFTINIWKSISDFVIGTWQNIKTFAGNIWTNISDLIKGKIDLRTFVINVWGAIKDFLFNQWDLIKDFGFNIWTAVNDFIRNQWTLTKQFSSQLWNDIKTFLINNWTSIKDFASSVWSTTKDFIINQWTITKEFTMQIWGAIKNYVINNWTAIKNFGASAFSGLRDTLVNITTGLQTTLINIFESIKNRLLQVFSSIQNVGSQAFNGLLYSIKSAVNSILKALNWMIGQLNRIHFSIPSWVPVLGGKSWGFNIPYISLLPMAAGGVVTKPTPALIGEAGPEAVMPLSPSSPFIKAIHDAVYEAIVTALSEAITQSNKRDNDKIIVLEVNGRELARTTIEDFATVAKRLGVKFG